MVDADTEQVNVDFEQVHVYREQSSGFTVNFEHVNVGSGRKYQDICVQQSTLKPVSALKDSKIFRK